MSIFYNLCFISFIRFKVWLQLYHWRKAVLVFVTATLILVGFFFMLSVTQFEDFSTTKKENYQQRTKESKLHSSVLRKEFHTSTKSKSQNQNLVLRFLINEPYFCLEQEHLYIIAISSSPKNFEQRMAIRNTWGSAEVLNSTKGAILFLFGRINNHMRLQKQIYEESMNYRDIVQGDFIDSYRNLTQKSIMALKWFSSYCSQVKFLMKTDDDIFVNTELLATYLKENESKKRWIVGCIKTHAAYPTQMKSNNALPVLSLPYGHPTFVAGAGYVMSNDIIELLYKESQQLKLVPVEDVFITGHCAKALGIKPDHNSKFSCGEVVKNFCSLGDSMFTGHHITADLQGKIWDLIHDPKSCKRTD